jgi:hypothetical protein
VLTQKWRQLGHEIGFGIGIAHGYATLGNIGFEGRFDYAAIGTVSGKSRLTAALLESVPDRRTTVHAANNKSTQTGIVIFLSKCLLPQNSLKLGPRCSTVFL